MIQNFLIPVIVSVAVILIWHGVFVFLRRRYEQYRQSGFNEAGLQIYNEIKTKGKVTLTLNSENMIIGEISKKNRGNN